MLSLWKKSPSPGNAWIFDWVDEPDIASAPSTIPSGPLTSTSAPIRRNRAITAGLKSSIVTR